MSSTPQPELAAVRDRRIVATDLSPAMLEVAKAEVPAANVEWLPADAGELPFENAAFDTVVCQFGAMFCPDKPKAFGETASGLARGWPVRGRAVGSSRRKRHPARRHGSARRHLPRRSTGIHAKRTARLPRPRANRSRPAKRWIPRHLVRDARPSEHGRLGREAAVALCAGTPMRNDLAGRTAGDLASTIDAVAGALRQRFGTGPIEGKMQALLVEARR